MDIHNSLQSVKENPLWDVLIEGDLDPDKVSTIPSGAVNLPRVSMGGATPHADTNSQVSENSNVSGVVSKPSAFEEPGALGGKVVTFNCLGHIGIVACFESSESWRQKRCIACRGKEKR